MMSGVFLTWLILATLCGSILSAPSRKKRVVGGVDATIEIVPFQVSLRKKGGHLCAGSIINERCILTSAHCMEGNTASDFSIRYGKTSFCGDENVIDVERFLIHENFNRTTFEYDISLLILESDIPFSDVAQPTKLATEDPAAGTSANVTGWGAVTEQGGIPFILQRAEVNIVNTSDCKARVAPTLVPEKMLCAGVDGGGKDACSYDSGGPLVVNGTQVGIVSFGIGCGRPNFPGIYTSVAKLRDWIMENSKECSGMSTTPPTVN